MNTIPVFEAIINNIDCGIYRISLVDLPAVESDFVYFNKQNKVMKFNIENEEQRMVTGVIMRANFNIYRYDEKFGEYYIRYSPETIKEMSEKMMSDNTFNNINIMHEDGTDVEGVNLVELFIKDTSKGIDPKGFEDIENGSLFATYKIYNESLWQAIKEGVFKGFSLEGLFDLEQMKLHKQNNNKKNNNYNKMGTLFNRFLKSFVKCGSVETDKGLVYWVGEADLQIGDELFYNTENEEAVKVEDGEYRLNDGTVIVVSEGLVSEIREKDGEQEGELDMEKKQCMEDEIIVETPQEPETKETNKLWDDIDELKNKYDELKGMFDEMKDTLDEILNKPAANPIVEEFNKINKVENGIPTFGSRAKTLH